MTWTQNYNPLENAWLSTLAASLPIVVLLGTIAFGHIRIHLASLLGLLVAMVVAMGVFHMPAVTAFATMGYGALSGLFPIGWIILNLIFLYELTVEKGLFALLRQSLATIAPDPRIQVILVAFSFGAFFEGAAGFGTPVAVTAAILIKLGFKPLQASGLSLIANTAPVAFGALGTPIVMLHNVTGLDLMKLSQMVGRQLPFFSLIVPFWVVWAFAGFRGMMGVWPAALTAGLSFAIPQFLISNYHGPWLVDIVASLVSMTAVTALLRFWKPMPHRGLEMENPDRQENSTLTRKSLSQAWTPWIILSLLVFIWGLPAFKTAANKLSNPSFNVAGLHEAVLRAPPVSASNSSPEKAVFNLNWISATGTGILTAAVLAGFVMGHSISGMFRIYRQTLWNVRYSLLTISAMLALGYVTKYSGTDATLGLALAGTGVFYPFFGTLLGWLGVALTGSDTASNVLFGGLQKISAEQVGVSPILMGAANSSGGVMGKMVDAQSIVVASTATRCYGEEGAILRFVFLHSLVLAGLVGLLVTLQAYVPPFTNLVVK